MKIIGITGGIAAGKSRLATIFAARGFPVIDADAIARECLAPGGTGEASVRQAFGTTDRERLRQEVFADPAKRARLEAILHPLIQEESRRRFAALEAKGAAIAFYEAALLVETGRHRELDGVIVVTAPHETRLARLLARSKIPREDAEGILRAQLSDDERAKSATWVFTNAGEPAELERQATDWISLHAPGLSLK